MTITLSALQKQRYDTAANWTAENPTLLAGEIGVESDTGKIKIGTGATAWTSLSYSGLIPGSGVYPYSQLLMPSGTAGAPSISFDGDGDTGIYRSGANAVAISTSGSERIRIDASGTSVKGGLSVFDPNVEDPDATVYFGVFPSQDPVIYIRSYTGSYAPVPIAFKTGLFTSEACRIDEGGRLLIGTSYASTNFYGNTCTPKIQLDDNVSQGGIASIVNRSNNIGGTLILGAGYYSPPSVDAEVGALSFQTEDDEGKFLETASIKSFIDGTAGIDDMPGRLVFSTTADGASSPTERLRIGANGEIGIGGANYGTSGQVLTSAGSGAAPTWTTPSAGNTDKIEEGNSSAEVIDTGSDGRFVVKTEGSERARVDSSGRLLVGTSSAYTSRLVQIEGISGSTTNISIARHEANSNAPVIELHKTRGTSNGSKTLVQDGDGTGTILFAGADGTNNIINARIEAFVDGTPGANDMPGRLVFSTTADGASSPTERMRIRSDGTVTFSDTATTDPIGASKSGGFSAGIGANSGALNYYNSNDNALKVGRGSDGSLVAFFRNQPSAVSVGSISVTTTATAYNTSSDYRLKENVVPLTGAAARLNQLQVHRFNFIADPDKTVDGFLAHEAQAVVPECVTGTKDEVDADGNPVYQGIDQSKLVPLLTAALQEALAEIESLKARVTALEP